MMEKNRIEWVDALKGVAILWLIMYHFYIFDWLRSPVPVFFFLSGLFFSQGKSFKDFIKKKTKALLIPFLFFFVLGIVASLVGSLVGNKAFSFPPIWMFFTFIPADSEVSNPLGVGAIWFLASLFELYVLYFFMKRFFTSQALIIVITLLLWLFSAFLMERYAMGSILYLFYSICFLPFFVAGDLLKEKVLRKETPIWLVLSTLLYSTTFIPTDVMGGGIVLRIRDFLSSMGLVIILVYVVKFIDGFLILSKVPLTHKLIVFEGMNSLTILGVHMLAIPFGKIFLAKLNISGSMYFVLLFLFVTIVSNICVLLFNRYLPFFVNKPSKSYRR